MGSEGAADGEAGSPGEDSRHRTQVPGGIVPTLANRVTSLQAGGPGRHDAVQQDEKRKGTLSPPARTGGEASETERTGRSGRRLTGAPSIQGMEASEREEWEALALMYRQQEASEQRDDQCWLVQYALMGQATKARVEKELETRETNATRGQAAETMGLSVQPWVKNRRIGLVIRDVLDWMQLRHQPPVNAPEKDALVPLQQQEGGDGKDTTSKRRRRGTSNQLGRSSPTREPSGDHSPKGAEPVGGGRCQWRSACDYCAEKKIRCVWIPEQSRCEKCEELKRLGKLQEECRRTLKTPVAKRKEPEAGSPKPGGSTKDNPSKRRVKTEQPSEDFPCPDDSWIGRVIWKEFEMGGGAPPEYQWFHGKITEWTGRFFRVLYSDADTEEMTEEQLLDESGEVPMKRETVAAQSVEFWSSLYGGSSPIPSAPPEPPQRTADGEGERKEPEPSQLKLRPSTGEVDEQRQLQEPLQPSLVPVPPEGTSGQALRSSRRNGKDPKLHEQEPLQTSLVPADVPVPPDSLIPQLDLAQHVPRLPKMCLRVLQHCLGQLGRPKVHSPPAHPDAHHQELIITLRENHRRMIPIPESVGGLYRWILWHCPRWGQPVNESMGAAAVREVIRTHIAHWVQSERDRAAQLSKTERELVLEGPRLVEKQTASLGFFHNQGLGTSIQFFCKEMELEVGIWSAQTGKPERVAWDPKDPTPRRRGRAEVARVGRDWQAEEHTEYAAILPLGCPWPLSDERETALFSPWDHLPRDHGDWWEIDRNCHRKARPKPPSTLQMTEHEKAITETVMELNFPATVVVPHPRGDLGVKTCFAVSKGTVMFQYVGEVISERTAISRKDSTYILKGGSGQDAKFYIDAIWMGSKARFVNHSCEPNLRVEYIWADTTPPEPIVFFTAMRDLGPQEWVTFHYKLDMWGFVCDCGSPSCVHREPGSVPSTVVQSHRPLSSSTTECEACGIRHGNGYRCAECNRRLCTECVAMTEPVGAPPKSCSRCMGPEKYKKELLSKMANFLGNADTSTRAREVLFAKSKNEQDWFAQVHQELEQVWCPIGHHGRCPVSDHGVLFLQWCPVFLLVSCIDCGVLSTKETLSGTH
mmetsp:Transcript_61087/g.126077  ORF Transcript_61087/g.126077 Transcript_61087/m.126077 type:complete len:1093 (+) Transcript_61087:2125-5403(+)